MRTSRISLIVTVTVSTIIALSACSKKKLDPVCDGSDITYDNYMKAFITSNCLGGSCHSSGSGNSDLTSFAKVQVYVNNGQFEKEVLSNQTMPEDATLSQDELNKIQCWADAGYPEN